jgi:site-specific DNA-methyltransferase (adenine-specific)
MEWLVTLVTPSNGIVLDPFAGSGTTLVAAKRLGFSFIGIERDPEYAQIITARVGEDAATPGVLCAD